MLCLHTLTESLPSSPLGKKLHDLYLLCMEKHIVEHGQFDMAWNLLGMMSREALSVAVRKCVVILDDSLPQQEGDAQSPASRTLQMLRAFLAELERIDAQAHAEEEKEGEGGLVAGDVQTTSERKMKFQERLRQISSRKREPSAYEKARKTLLDRLLLTIQ
jgi:hypothetical protein